MIVPFVVPALRRLFGGGDIEPALARIEQSVLIVLREGIVMSTKLDTLTAAVARSTSVADSAVELIKGLSQQIKDAGGDEEKLKALTDALDSNTTELAEAVRSGSESEDDSDDDAPVVIGGPITETPNTKPIDDTEHGTPVPESNPTYAGTVDPNGPDSPVVLTGANTDRPGDASAEENSDTAGPSADAVAKAERTPNAERRS